MDELEFHDSKLGPNPATASAFRRQVILEIYLPFFLGVAALAAVAILLWRSGTAGASAWADASTMLMLLPVLVLSLLPIVILAGAAYGVTWLIGKIPGPAHQAQSALAQVARTTKRATKTVIRPFFTVYATAASVRRGVQVLLSIVQRRDESET
ncbi:MAG: hypothetical protein WBR18_11235 [Anaerolineales bacterium]